jgi:hypothetical protein
MIPEHLKSEAWSGFIEDEPVVLRLAETEDGLVLQGTSASGRAWEYPAHINEDGVPVARVPIAPVRHVICVVTREIGS